MHAPSHPIRLVLLSATLLAAVSLSGCSTDSRVLARVGSRTITVAEFKDVASQVASRFSLPPDTARGLVLDELIRRELMLAAVHGNPATPDSFVARRRADIETEALSRALLTEMTPRNVGVSDAEVRRLYVWRQQATHCQLVFTTSARSAGLARAAIDAGEDFSRVAERFDVTGMLPPGGDLGFVEAGALVSPLDRIVRETPVGAVVGPVEAPGQGWFVIKIVSREARERAPIEQQAAELRGMLEQRKQRITLLDRYAELRDAYHVEVDHEGIAKMYERFNAARQTKEFGGDPSAMQLTPAERATVVGRWDGGSKHYRGTLTMGEAVDDLMAGRGTRIATTRLDSYEDWVRNAILQRVAVVEARRRHLDEEPATAKQISESVDEMLLQAVYQTEVVNRAEPNDQELREIYERNAADLAVLKSVTVQYLTLPESTMAVHAAEKVMDSGGTLANAVMISSASFGVKQATIHFPTSDPSWEMLHAGLARQRVGQLIGPIHIGDGWRLVQIMARDAPVPAFEDLPQQTQDGLRQQARQIAAQRRLKEYTDSLRTTTPIFVDRELLKSIPWPAPAGMQMIPGMMGS